MSLTIDINKNHKKPIYQQIVDWVGVKITDATLKPGDQLPSINQIAGHNQLARETVVKAFRLLQEEGLVEAVHGKGFYITSGRTMHAHRVFLLLDALSAYKGVLFAAIKKEFGEKATVDICFHHYNPRTFEMLVNEAAGNYSAYIVLPLEHRDITEMLDPIPYHQLFLVDRWPHHFAKPYQGVYQDFFSDIQRGLHQCSKQIGRYEKLNLVFRETATELPLELMEGFEEFCYQHKFHYSISQRSLVNNGIKQGEAYITIDDNDLVALVETAGDKNWRIGQDIGLLSYNDTPLKKVVAGGITVISTDFAEMGQKVARQVMNNKKECLANQATFIDRGSF